MVIIIFLIQQLTFEPPHICYTLMPKYTKLEKKKQGNVVLIVVVFFYDSPHQVLKYKCDWAEVLLYLK